jgi:hypothetical protein
MKTYETPEYAIESAYNNGYKKGYEDGKMDAVTNGLYTSHEVAEIIAELFGDDCACNFNSIDEWLPFKCELQEACPNPVGVACWEQYLKYRSADMRGEKE